MKEVSVIQRSNLKIKKNNSISLKKQYEIAIDEIKKELGDLEAIRFKLSLSRRQMALLLMVDPSAWTRWSTGLTPVPPHVYRALSWYLLLIEKNPEVHKPLELEKKLELLKKEADLKVLKLKSDIEELKYQKHQSIDPVETFSKNLQIGLKNLSDRLIEFQDMKGVGELEILKYENQKLKTRLSEIEALLLKTKAPTSQKNKKKKLVLKKSKKKAPKKTKNNNKKRRVRLKRYLKKRRR